MNRRDFLAATATALYTTGLVHGAEPARRIPIGFLGVTYSHGPDKVRLAQRSPDWDLVGVCDESESGRQVCERLGVKRIKQEELFRRAEVVAVESDIRDHAAHALRALRAGKHVHLEKPPAATLTELRSLVAEARGRKRLLQTGFMWRFNPGFRVLFEVVHHGWLGDIMLVRAFMGTNLAPARRAEWAEFPGGAMFEQGSHLVDAAVRLLGRPQSVIPFLRRQGKFADTLHDNNVAVLQFERATAVLTNTALQATGSPQRSFEVTGTRGSALLQPIESPTLVLDLAEAAGPYPKGPHTVPLPAYERYVADFQELAAAVRGEAALSVSLDEESLVGETVLRACGMS